jgi:separase
MMLICGLIHLQVLGQDASLAQFCPQYRALLHFWLALHAHRREDPQQTSLIAHHSEEACRILKSSFIGSATEPLNKASPAKKSPKTLKGKAKGKAITTGTKPVVARRGPPTKSSRNVDPVTPKSRKGMCLFRVRFDY